MGLNSFIYQSLLSLAENTPFQFTLNISLAGLGSLWFVCELVHRSSLAENTPFQFTLNISFILLLIMFAIIEYQFKAGFYKSGRIIL